MQRVTVTSLPSGKNQRYVSKRERRKEELDIEKVGVGDRRYRGL